MPRKRILALVLAGGEGGRLGVLTEKRAKPALPFAGVYRLIDFALSNCMHSGISDVWIVEQYQPHSLNEHLAGGRPWDLDRTYGGLRVLPPYVTRSEDGEGGFAQGNADALFRNRAAIRAFAPDLVLVLSADHVYKLDYNRVLDRHLESGADVTLVTTQVPGEEAGRYGTLQVDQAGRVTDFEYKPEHPRWDTVATEVFLYDAPRLLDLLDELGEGENGDKDEPSLHDWGHELIPRFVRDGRAFAFPLDGYWKDVGTPESYWLAHMEMLGSEPALQLDDPAWPILSYGTQRLPVWLHGSAHVADSLLSPGCVVHGEVVRSVLGPGVIVEEGARVRDSVLLNDVRVESGATVEFAVVDEGKKIENGSTVAGTQREPALTG